MKIAVLGIGCTKFGEFWDKNLQDLLAESQIEALNDAKILASDIDAIFTGNMCAATASGQQQLGAIAAEILNSNVASSTIEGACGSGGLALRAGIMAIEAKMADVVMVNGVEKLTDLSASEASSALAKAASEELEHYHGATFPALNALVTREYMSKYGLTRKELAMVSVKNHKNAMQNPLAQFKKEITIKDVINSPMIADPLTLLDCAPISDGAASIIICSENFAKKINHQSLVYIIGSGQATDTLALQHRESLTSMKATSLAATQAYKMANITPQDIDLVELHDGFSVLELITLEDLGFYQKGQAKFALKNGETSSTGKLPVNLSGGLKGKGHPVGATGISQVIEIVKQLRGQYKNIQQRSPKIGLTHNMGGVGTTVAVHILKKED